MKPHNQGLAIDEIFLALGWRGRYWRRQFVAAMLPVLSCALHIMSVVFIGRTVEHRCAPVGSLSISLQYGDLTFTYDVIRNDSEYNFTVQYKSCTTDVMNGTDKIYSTSCVDGYEFMEPKDASIVSQWDLVCDREALSDVSQTLLSLGQMVGAFCFTYVADRYGRKPVFVVAHISLFIIGAAIAFSPNVITFLILRFFLGAMQQGTELTAVILLVEMLPTQRRALPSQIGCIFWPSSLLFLCFLAYITKHLSWQYSELVFAAFSIFAIFQWWTSDESLRWLIANNKREEAERIVMKAAKLNNVDFKKMKTLLEQALQEKQEITSLTALNDFTNSNHVTDDHSTQLVDNDIRNGDGPAVVAQGEDKMRLMAFFKNRHIIKITLLSSYFWLTDSVAYYGMLLTSTSLTDDIYLGFLLNVAVEIPAGVAFIVFINRYAEDYLSSTTLSPNSRFNKWTATSVEEMWAFLGLILAMGLIQVADLSDYWSTDTLYSHAFFCSTMSRDRFMRLLTFLHINDNREQVPRGQPGHDPLHKVAPFLNCLARAFKECYYPQQNIAIDEAMIAWRGAIHFKVFNPDKPDKYGMKIFEVCDSKTGYCCGFEMYTGKRQTSRHGATYDVVMRLLEDYLDSGHRLYVDNYYSSPTLFRHLAERRTAACGTLRCNRIGVPAEMKKKKLVKKKGDEKAMTTGDMNMIKFMDRKEVNILTTIHSNRRAATGKKDIQTGEDIVRHEAVIEYNKFMGAVDRSDQMIQYGAFRRKTLKWWKKVFFHFLMLAELNAYLLYKSVMAKKEQRPMDHKTFRKQIAKELAAMAPVATQRKSVRTLTPAVGDTADHRLTARHFPSKIKHKGLQDGTQNATKKRPSRLCKVCSSVGCKQKPSLKRRQTSVECVPCNVGLCIDPCFQLWHTQKDYKRALRRLEENEEQPEATT